MFSPPLIFPATATERDYWAVWKYVDDRKVPHTVQGRYASCSNPADWCSYDEALRVFERYRRYYAGLAFAFLDPPEVPDHLALSGIDLDSCLNASGELKPWARPFLEQLYDTYAEISPRGLGLKLWVRGRLPGAIPKVKIADGGLEAYSSGRFFTVTGRRFRNAPLDVADHHAWLQKLWQTHRGEWAAARGATGPNALSKKIPYGTQHLALVSLAGTLRRRGVCDEAILTCLLKVNELQCERPGPAKNIEQIVRSTKSWSIYEQKN